MAKKRALVLKFRWTHRTSICINHFVLFVLFVGSGLFGRSYGGRSQIGRRRARDCAEDAARVAGVVRQRSLITDVHSSIK